MTKIAKPFLKWVGGKTQLLPEIRDYYPSSGSTYVEPFVGAGAVFLDVAAQVPFKEFVINDINVDLINTYRAIKQDVEQLIDILDTIQSNYLNSNADLRKAQYYINRLEFNSVSLDSTDEPNFRKAALLIFLNKTCFNGLYRVNKKGGYNAAHGRYKNPPILDAENLRLVSKVLQPATILCGAYANTLSYVDQSSFIYLDPPYRPISNSANFTKYSMDTFNDNSQRKLKVFVDAIAKKRATFLLSNSDPKNNDEEDDFFDDLYEDYIINRVLASRRVSTKGTGRGKVKEIMFTNKR